MRGAGRTSQAPAEYLSTPDVLLYHSAASDSGQPPNTWTTMRPAGGSTSVFGPELGFGHRLRELFPSNRIAVIKHSVGGTHLAGDWRPGADPSDTGNFGPQFSTFVNTVNGGLAALETMGYTPRLRGMAWMQGEADAHSINPQPQYADAYETNLVHFIARVREQFQDVPNMPFVYGQVLPHSTGPSFVGRDTVRQAQANVDQDSGHSNSVFAAFMIPTEPFGVHSQIIDGYRDSDDVHFHADGLIGLGGAFADRLGGYLADTDGDGMPDWWEQAHFGNPTNALPQLDDDGDGASNLEEYAADTEPETDQSILRLWIPEPEGDDLRLYWRQGPRARGVLEYTADLLSATQIWQRLYTNPVPALIDSTWLHPNVVRDQTNGYYRISAERPD